MVYVLEDDRDIRELLGFFLSSENIVNRTFESIGDFNGSKGAILPDLYILDVNLPDGNGLDLAKILQQDALTAHIPILIMSAHLLSSIYRNMSIGNDFIQKPFDLDDFKDRVNKLTA